jgi:glutathione S-transferase
MQLTYFDTRGGRGQVARLAFEIAGMPFEDNRVVFKEFMAMKESLPFGCVPTLQVDGQTLAQSNAINRYVGRLTKLYPDDPWQAALCDQAMDADEDLNTKLGPSLWMKDEEEKKQARKELAEGPIPYILRCQARSLESAGGQYFADGRLTVGDLKVFVTVRALCNGVLDHIPTDIVEKAAPSLVAHYNRIMEVPAVSKHYA